MLQIVEGNSTGATFHDAPSPSKGILTLKDSSECRVCFNVMPGRPVHEELRMVEYRIGPSWIEAEFDRDYQSSMLCSPSHLTFISALIQMQKVTYIYLCLKFGFDPDVAKEEALKIWPTDVSIAMRGLVSKETSLVHRIDFAYCRRTDARKYLTRAQSHIGALQIDATAMVTLLSEPCRAG